MFTTTKVPRFAGMTNWEQYRQVFDAIVLFNGWDDAWGGEFAAQISSKVRPQDPGVGAARMAIPREAVDMEMRSSSVSSVVEPQSVRSRILVVLVEEAEVRGAECLASVPVGKATQLLAGAARPASVTVCEDCIMMPGAVGTLSPSIFDSVGPVGHVGSLSRLTLTLLAHLGRCPRLTLTQ